MDLLLRIAMLTKDIPDDSAQISPILSIIVVRRADTKGQISAPTAFLFRVTPRREACSDKAITDLLFAVIDTKDSRCSFCPTFRRYTCKSLKIKLTSTSLIWGLEDTSIGLMVSDHFRLGVEIPTKPFMKS